MLLTNYIADQIWLCTYSVRLAGTRFDARMTVLRLASGEIVLHSPCNITANMAEEISALGPVAHIVVPGNFHHLHALSAQAAFPAAKTWICPGIERKRSDLKYDGILGDVAPADWMGEIDQALVQGRIMSEVAMYHRESHTLILVDLIENFTDSTPHMGGTLKFWFKYVLRMWGHPKPAPEYTIGWSDRVAAAKSLRRILAWDFRQIVLSHGDLINHDAHEVAAEAWSGLLGGYTNHMNKRPLWVYVIGVLIALGIVNYVAWLTGGEAKLHMSQLVSVGFLLGMLAMYIAVHLYRWK